MLREALPEGFDFYSLGTLVVAPEPTGTLDDPAELAELAFVAFRYSGDEQGLILTAFDRGLDSSMYTEMGNVLASRFADRLSRLSDGVGVGISPPLALEAEPARRLLQAAAQRRTERLFHHVHGNIAVPVRMIVLPHASGTEAWNV
ncbi:MAG: hypothetical protein NDJ90_14160 [Oligoflexia bacterium]|nr:hypothetical protein [Oligoflexia bacterium]